MTLYTKPLPRINDDTRPFWEGCRAHELRVQKCTACDHVRWPASIICPNCHSLKTTWITAAGTGTVYSFVIYHVAYHPAFSDDLPYVAAVVELTEGPRIFTNIIECSPEAVTCDMPVEVVWDDVTDEVTLPKFRPVR